MSEILGSVLSYVCQLAIILFVLKEFGVIISPWANQTVQEPTAERGAPGGFDFGGLMQGVLSGLQQGPPGKGEKKGKRKPAIEDKESAGNSAMGVLDVE